MLDDAEEVVEKEGIRRPLEESEELELVEMTRDGTEGSGEEELSRSSLTWGRRLSPFFDLVLTMPRRPCLLLGGE